MRGFRRSTCARSEARSGGLRTRWRGPSNGRARPLPARRGGTCASNDKRSESEEDGPHANDPTTG